MPKAALSAIRQRDSVDSEGRQPLVVLAYDARCRSTVDRSDCSGRRRGSRSPSTRGRRNGQRDDGAERALLELLSHGLSDEEIQRVLAAALLALDERGRDRLFTRLGAETGATLRRLLASRATSRTKAPPSPGSAKIREQWDKAWSEWEACVAESGDEDGRYVVREHHWEEPDLDGSSLAQDLEHLAARMRKLIV